MTASLLIWGFKTNDIEAVRTKLEEVLDVKFEVGRNDDTGVHYITRTQKPPDMELYPNLEIDEEGEHFDIEDFAEYPLLFVITRFEARPDIVETIEQIPDLGVELLQREDQ